MRYTFIIRPEAENDLEAAYDWYERQKEGLGKEFLRCVDAAVSLITRSPQMYSNIHKNIRRALIRRFPYGIFYLVEEQRIIVLAVFHVKRNPDRWKRRFV